LFDTEEATIFPTTFIFCPRLSCGGSAALWCRTSSVTSSFGGAPGPVTVNGSHHSRSQIREAAHFKTPQQIQQSFFAEHPTRWISGFNE